MVNITDLKSVVEHIVNGTFNENLCIVCLMPLDELCENIFTRICKQDKEYCIAEILEEVCKIQFSEEDNFCVCSDCFILATAAYKFYMLTKNAEEIFNFYVDNLEKNVNAVEVPQEVSSDFLCITVPEILSDISHFDYNLDGVTTPMNIDSDVRIKTEQKNLQIKKHANLQDDDIVVFMYENGKPSFFKPNKDGSLDCVDDIESNNYSKSLNASSIVKKKQIRRRGPMSYKLCSKCPIKYRFVAKLKEHMKIDHNIDLYVCKVCKAIIEDEQEFNNHLKTHTNIHCCAICNVVFKRRDSIISHLKWHDSMKNLSKQDGAHICELCGTVLVSEEHLKDHNHKKHDKKYTCYYCGRMYKGELSFEMHIKKHEDHIRKNDPSIPQTSREKSKASVQHKRVSKYNCTTCGRDFVDERALLWHSRLHTNERPYKCDVCGRGYVSVNRRNQHAVCAHTAPTRRCPLCPALFHLRSMVNTHVRKVHLNAHKRRNRTTKHQNVFWRTEPVPVQELSVSIQNEILELQTSQKENISSDWKGVESEYMPAYYKIED